MLLSMTVKASFPPFFLVLQSYQCACNVVDPTDALSFGANPVNVCCPYRQSQNSVGSMTVL